MSQTPKPWISDNTIRTATVVAQITQSLAICVAGFWALYVWTETVQPGSSTGIQATGEIASIWNEQSNSCIGSFRINLENVGVKKAKLEEVTYSIAPIPVQRLSKDENFRLLQFVIPIEKPISGSMPSLQGNYAPKDMRFKEIHFLFKPDIDVKYSVEVILAEEKTSTLVNQWFGEIGSCKKTVLSSRPD